MESLSGRRETDHGTRDRTDGAFGGDRVLAGRAEPEQATMIRADTRGELTL
jgi:hypothetical protein